MMGDIRVNMSKHRLEYSHQGLALNKSVVVRLASPGHWVVDVPELTDLSPSEVDCLTTLIAEARNVAGTLNG